MPGRRAWKRVVEVTTYTAVCRRSGQWWAISVPEIKGVYTQVRRLDQAADMARDAIALMLEVDPATIQVEVKPEVPAPVEVSTAAAARQLLEDGYTIRDVGRLLGLSSQRISQIAPGASHPRRRAAA